MKALLRTSGFWFFGKQASRVNEKMSVGERKSKVKMIKQTMALLTVLRSLLYAASGSSAAGLVILDVISSSFSYSSSFSLGP